MNERGLVMIPGPTNVDPVVLRSMARPTLSHVSVVFANIFRETLADLGHIFKTTGLILPLAGSGTLGSEVGLANIIEPDDRVLSISGGYFGDRLTEVAATLGAKVDELDVAWGSAANLGEVERKLSSTNYKAMLVVHVDTSTGVANPAEALAKLAKRKNVLFVLDTVCSMGGMDVQVDNWGIDVCFTGSQKALAIPPGMTIISFGSNALAARNRRKSALVTYYGDIKRWEPILQDPTKYFATPAVNMMYALHQSCKMILSEGLEARFARHAKLASAFRAGLRSIGLRLLCEESIASNTLTVAYYPEGISDAEFRKTMAEKYGVIVAGGLGPLKEKAFRVGHMGNVNRNDILATISAIEGSLAEQDYGFKAGSGIAAANRALMTP
jgi:alanine-glyoxylate transaminase/serine-glyoxylate transaminase/serine-pyruvate transaminase